MGRPTKATPELIEAVVADLARGLTREMACAVNGISDETLTRWERQPKFRGLRARVVGTRIKALLEKMEESKEFGQWKLYAWMLERTRAFEGQFTDPNAAAKVAVNVNQANIGQAYYLTGEHLERARAALDEAQRIERDRNSKEISDAVDAARNGDE